MVRQKTDKRFGLFADRNNNREPKQWQHEPDELQKILDGVSTNSCIYIALVSFMSLLYCANAVFLSEQQPDQEIQNQLERIGVILLPSCLVISLLTFLSRLHFGEPQREPGRVQM